MTIQLQILYTGDMRYIDGFKTVLNNDMQIDQLILDTTFADRDVWGDELPSKEQSTIVVINLIREHGMMMMMLLLLSL